jgi:hypothetical protein
MVFMKRACFVENVFLANEAPRAWQQTMRAKLTTNKMPDVDLMNRHPALQSMCSKD